MLLSTQHGSAAVMIAPGFLLILGLDGQGGDVGDGEPVYLAPPVTTTQGIRMAKGNDVPCSAQRIPPSVGRRLREELEAEFPLDCQCHNCLRGRNALQLV
ncbi:MAG: hypothetical protein AAB391_03755 [Patescibacteria group bacterium]